MPKKTYLDVLGERLEKHGMKAAFVSVDRLGELRDDIEGKHGAGEFDETFFRERLSRFRFSPPETMADASAIIVIAVPQPQVRVTFTVDGKALPVMLPPTYSEETMDGLNSVLYGFIRASGCRLETARLPEKLLGVRSGLAKYGRNNIAYIDGMGSFFQLNVYFTNAACGHDRWTDVRAADSCDSCTACLNACPSGAIRSDRFLIRAERCLTYLNEREDDFPDWVDPAWHHCLVGCMRCQLCCPRNRNNAGWISDREGFSEEETRLILGGTPPGSLSRETAEKLEKLGVFGYLGLLPRNLAAVLPGTPVNRPRTP